MVDFARFIYLLQFCYIFNIEDTPEYKAPIFPKVTQRPLFRAFRPPVGTADHRYRWPLQSLKSRRELIVSIFFFFFQSFVFLCLNFLRFSLCMALFNSLLALFGCFIMLGRGASWIHRARTLRCNGFKMWRRYIIII